MGKHKNTANPERWKAMHALRSSNAAQPHRNKKHYHRPSDKRVPDDD